MDRPPAAFPPPSPPQVMHRALRTARFRRERNAGRLSLAILVLGEQQFDHHCQRAPAFSDQRRLIFMGLEKLRFALRPHSPQAVSVPSFRPRGQIPQYGNIYGYVIHTSSYPDPRSLKLYDSRRWQTGSWGRRNVNESSKPCDVIRPSPPRRDRIVMSAESVRLGLPLGCSEA
ncbi:hypothetical protein CORC01_01138 [Colletotrichum orchidophilum]|uniref:Uncharacterized protein n=1 Tax=Colletotrichum orchidophilum TaxID=1209926 RepID=A0A1G4BPP2_9PEZI|nr:uncharacterized protein CORC01_01138 [Colletotrichum orchidophilum]OHF03419.1 hypothetical protein CORC01_01138 [Colletotrichum orchidophilum]